MKKLIFVLCLCSLAVSINAYAEADRKEMPAEFIDEGTGAAPAQEAPKEVPASGQEAVTNALKNPIQPATVQKEESETNDSVFSDSAAH